MTMRFYPRHVTWLVLLLGVITAASSFWPIYRSFLFIDLNVNEGWNAYFSDAAYRGTKLYPSADQLITNNYPPLSFYVVGATGALCGNTVLAGRWISLLSIAAIAWAVGLIVKHLSGNRTAAIVGGLYFASTMYRFFPGYSGMNDPQLLSQAIMTFGFLGFLKAIARDRGYLLPILVMVLAGFFKHNIVAMPVVAFAWLLYQLPKRFLPSAAIALGAVAVGFALCHIAYEPDFWMNMQAPRTFMWQSVVAALAQLQWIAVGLVVWLYVGVKLRAVPAVKLINLWLIVGFVVFLLQKTSEGVAANAEFDLNIAVSAAVGIAFAHAWELPLVPRYSPERLRGWLVIAIGIRLIASPGTEVIRLLFDPGFHEQIAVREAAMRDGVARVQATPGDVFSPTIICYWAGKPFVVDAFNADQRMKHGRLPKDAIVKRIAEGTLTYVEVDRRYSWTTPLGDWGPPKE